MVGRTGNKRTRNRRTVRVVLIFVFLIAVLVFFSGLGNERMLDDTKSRVESTTAPILSVLTMPVRGFEGLVESFNNRSRAHRENARLKQELAQLKDIEARANAMAIKLSRFETILNVDMAAGLAEQKVAARAVSEQSGPFVRSVLLDVGTNKGIKVGHAVMTADGFLGHVTRVGKRSARVLQAEDLNSRIAVMSERSQARAIMTGRNSAYPVLDFIKPEDDWRDGDRIITSGDDGVLPFGLPVGALRYDQSGTAHVDLYASQNNVDWVWVYLFDPILPPEDDPVEATETLPETETAQTPSEGPG